jgi:4-amino-4-deoxy-L-arabinose transferase-like glycosyltransferase
MLTIRDILFASIDNQSPTTLLMKSRDKVNNSFLKTETTRDLLGLLLLSAILKIIMVLFIGVINHDGVLYITAAQKIAAGFFKEGLAVHGGPLYSLFITLTHFLIPNWIAAARLVSIVASILTIIPLYLLTKEIFHRKAAMWAGCAFALLPLSNHLSVEVIRDPLFLFFFAWSTYFANRAIKSKKSIHFLLSSLTCLISILCRIEGLVLYVFYILFVIYLLFRDTQERINLLKGALIYVVLPLLLIALGSLISARGLPSPFNRMRIVRAEIKRFINLEILDSFKSIHDRLEALETSGPNKPPVQNFIEIARHYMTAIYLIGLLESFIKALFPLYLVPLVVGFWKVRNRNGVFVALLAGCYLLMSYYLLIRLDSIRVRHLLTPAFLLHPWIGAGIDRIVIYVRGSSRQRLLTILILLLFGVLPIYRSVKILWKQDTVLVRAGKWIADIPEFQAARIITNDRRVPFYAAQGADFDFFLSSDFFYMEDMALKRELDLLIMKVPKKKENQTVRLKKFRKVKKFFGKKNIIIIYCSPKLYESVQGRKL